MINLPTEIAHINKLIADVTPEITNEIKKHFNVGE
jgi:hypothetical protein